MLKRKNGNELHFANRFNIPVSIFGNQQVDIEKEAVAELNAVIETQHTIEQLSSGDLSAIKPAINQVAVTPDFHKGAGIPIGTVIKTNGCILPQAIGNDVNCGMRLYATNFDVNQIEATKLKLEQRFRHMFFGGGRQIPTFKNQREAILKEGLLGVWETFNNSTKDGIWKYYNKDIQEKELMHVEKNGSWKTSTIHGMKKFLGTADVRRDSQLGSIGGGNHFVEIQKVRKIFDGAAANLLGVKIDSVMVMIHTGSLMIGHASGAHFLRLLRDVYPKHLKYPTNGIFPLIANEQNTEATQVFWEAMSTAANFAFVNRLLLGLMTMATLSEVIEEADFNLIYDAPHNLVWKEEDNNFIHRKGACPARSAEQLIGTPFEYIGEPVMIPGSMGASSFLMKGLGQDKSLCSASHGAGRRLSRGKAQKGSEDELKAFLKKFKVVTPIDPNRIDIKRRKDIIGKWEDEIKHEAPWAYKKIGPVIQTQVDAKMVDRIAELEPLMTIKA